MLVTFTKVFGPNTKPPAKWTRWDYKTADDTRYVHFADSAEIPLFIAVNAEVDDNKIKSWEAVGSPVAANQQQPTQESKNGSQAATLAPVIVQAPPGRDFQAEAEGKTRCALVSQLLPAMFTALDAEDQTPEGAQVLLDWAFAYVFQTDSVPF